MAPVELSRVLEHIFAIFDQNSDGQIDQREGLAMAGHLGHQDEMQFWNKMLSDMDSNGDGKISLSEYVSYSLNHGMTLDSARLVKTELLDKGLDLPKKHPMDISAGSLVSEPDSDSDDENDIAGVQKCADKELNEFERLVKLSTEELGEQEFRSLWRTKAARQEGECSDDELSRLAAMGEKGNAIQAMSDEQVEAFALRIATASRSGQISDLGLDDEAELTQYLKWLCVQPLAAVSEDALWLMKELHFLEERYSDEDELPDEICRLFPRLLAIRFMRLIRMPISALTEKECRERVKLRFLRGEAGIGRREFNAFLVSKNQPPAIDTSVLPELGGDPHLLQGISLGGVMNLLKVLNYPHYDFSEAGVFAGSYERPDDLSWITDTYMAYDPAEPMTLTGYDLCQAIRKFLKDNDKKDNSMCEVTLTHPKFCKHVGKAQLFYSHGQKFPINYTVQKIQSAYMEYRTAEAMMRNGEQGELEDVNYIWLDYFVLRQCHHDFQVDTCRGVIRTIGLTLSEIDDSELKSPYDKAYQSTGLLDYTQRIFCVFELFATIDGNAKLICECDMERQNMEKRFEEKPLNCKDAQSRSEKAKEQIIGFIESNIGAEEFDKKVMEAILNSCRQRW